MDVWVALHGMYPRGEALIQATRDFDRYRISFEALLQAYDEDYQALKSLQEGAYLVSDGLLNWQDLVRPFAELTGAQPQALTRYFETNTFYRKLRFTPVVTWGDIAAWAERYFRFGTLAFLPSPYTFVAMAENLKMEDATALLAEVAAHLVQRGFHTLAFMDPFLAYRADAQALPGLKRAFETLRERTPQARLLLTLPFGNAAALMPAVWDLPVDGVGVDLTLTDIREIQVPQGRGLMLGIVDTTNSLLETREVMQEALDHARSLGPAFLVLSGSADFFYLPRAVADAKYRILREMAEALRATA